MRYFLFHIFAILVTEEAAILDGHFVKKNVLALCEDLCATVLVLIHSEVLENCHFNVFTILATTADGHIGLPSQINLKQLHLQIVLTERD